jgi:hypothetical protein
MNYSADAAQVNYAALEATREALRDLDVLDTGTFYAFLVGGLVGYVPTHDFRRVLDRAAANVSHRSDA